jgi:hypothetical protein
MENQAPEIKPQVGRRGGKLFKYFFYVLILAIGIAGGIFIAQQRPTWFGLSQGPAATQAEADAKVAQVSKLIALPTDEKPTIATVTDASKVKSQLFFQNAVNGDIVLIYTKAQKAILYRPSENRIIEVGALNINNQAVQSPLPSPSPSGKAKPTPTPAQ